MAHISESTIKALKRMPELYKRQAMFLLNKELELAEQKIRLASEITADCVTMAAMLAQIEHCDCNIEEGSTELQDFVSAVQEQLDDSADLFEECVREGLHRRLENYGVFYNLHGEGWRENNGCGN